LYGEEPNENIENIILLSYSKNIKNWITRCIEKVAQKPTLRETLIQYLNLIKKLTYKSDNQGFIMEVKELLLQKDNLKTLLSIEEAIIEAKIEIQLNFWKMLISYLREAQYIFTFYSIYGDRNIKESIYKYYTKKKNRKDYGFEYQVDNNLYFFIEIRDNIYYGFYFKEDRNVDKQIEILDKVKVEWEEPYWKYPNKRLNFEEFNNENILDLLDKNKKEIDIGSISDEVIYLITNYKKESNRC
ncbi:MAG: hypothetical protein KAU90_11655, partial [Sulfurovaceae bacterium]|nr:hypothetical protein [Sulfurovaceae bacterium]